MATSAVPATTDFTRDVLGRYVCNGLDEALRSADPRNPATRPFDVIVIGGGTFGCAFAQHLFSRDVRHRHRILVLEGGPFLLSEHVQNLPMLGLDPAAATSIADLRLSGQFGPDRPRAEVWGLPWHSPAKFPGLAYCVGGRSVYWGGWSPRPLDTELAPAMWPAAVVSDLSSRYFGEAASQLGADRTNDFIHGDLHRALRQLLLDGIKHGQITDAVPLAQLPLHLDPGQTRPGQEDLNKLEAPLAVQTHTRPGFFPFNKFSAVPLLIKAARASAMEAEFDDARRRLMLVPRCHTKRLWVGQNGTNWVVNAVETDQGTIVVPPGGIVVLALGTIESTRLALASFQGIPGSSEIGKNLIAHLRSNLDIRIPRESLPGRLAAELQASALFVKGRHAHADGSLGHFHLQITACGLGAAGTNSEAELFRKVPDLDGFEAFRSANDRSVVVTVRGIGEMESLNPASFVQLDAELDEWSVPRAFVSIAPSPKDRTLWDAMDQAADDVARVFANGKPFEVLGKRRDGLGTTHHEAGTLRMSDDPSRGVTDTHGRFHRVPNAYAVGPALFPAAGSPNPMLSGIALVRRTVDLLTAEPTAEAEAGFRALFDGTEATFGAWRMAGPGRFDLIDGALVAQPGGDIGLLYFPEGFGDFVLRLQFRLDRIDDNSGVFVRFRDPRLPVPRRDAPGLSDLYTNQAYVGVTTGFEIQIDELARGDKSKNPPEPDGMDKKRTGAIYDIPTESGGIRQSFSRGPALQPGMWNDYEIEFASTSAGDRIAVRLAGQQTTSYVNSDDYRGRSARVDTHAGFVGLQAHTGRVAFRNIRIKAL